MSTATVQNIAAMSGSERDAFAAWYDAKTEEVQELIDSISDMTSDIIDEADYDSFMKELDDNGIETAEQFKDAYAGQYDSGAIFAEQLCDELGYLSSYAPAGPIPDFILSHIDWQAVWDCELRHDYTMSDVGGYFFSRHF